MGELSFLFFVFLFGTSGVLTDLLPDFCSFLF